MKAQDREGGKAPSLVVNASAPSALDRVPVPTPTAKLKPVDRPRAELRSPASALFDTAYQGGAAVEVFSAGGSNPTSNWKVSGAVQRIYDKSVKGYVFQCDGGPSAKMQLPKDERRLLGLVQPYLVLQLSIPAAKPFALELSVSDTTRARRRVLVSTSFREPVRTPLHTRLPLAAVHRDVWLNLTFDLHSLVAANFPGATFSRLESLALGAVCKVRRVFTLREPPVEGVSSDHPVMNASGTSTPLRESATDLACMHAEGDLSPLPAPLPRGFEFPPGTVSMTYIYGNYGNSCTGLPLNVAGAHLAVGGGDGGSEREAGELGAGGGGASGCASPAHGPQLHPPWSPAFGSGMLSQTPATSSHLLSPSLTFCHLLSPSLRYALTNPCQRCGGLGSFCGGSGGERGGFGSGRPPPRSPPPAAARSRRHAAATVA